MSDQPRPGAYRRTTRLLAIAVIVFGLVIAAFFGVRSMQSFREIQYIRQHGLDRGTASVDAIRPWMTIRFIAVAYAVPEEYLYSALAIPFERRNADRALGELNRDYQLGLTPNGAELVIIDRARAAITLALSSTRRGQRRTGMCRVALFFRWWRPGTRCFASKSRPQTLGGSTDAT